MKEILAAFAAYNKRVNEDLIGILEKLPEEKLRQNTGTFYTSVFGTLIHIFSSDLAWVKRYQAFFTSNKSFESGEFLSVDPRVIANPGDISRADFFRLRKEMDNALIKFIGELDDGKLASVFQYKNYKGENQEKEVWKTLIQMFNHETHHRGAISASLDIMKIDNDYSTLLTRI
jgi:uncharacterized damage-inducible protein DinB